MTGRGESAWASRDPAPLTLQFVSDGTFQITGYIHSYRQMKRGRAWGEGSDGKDPEMALIERLCSFFSPSSLTYISLL